MWSTLEKLSLTPTTISNAPQATKIAVVAVAASVTTATVILGFQSSRQRQRAKLLKKRPPVSERSRQLHIDTSEQLPATTTTKVNAKDENKKIEFDEELVSEQLARNIAFLGEEGVQKLRNSFIVVVGAGGTGSWAASMLVKSGIGKIRIIDFDQLTLSELNQHASATRSDIGTPKAAIMKRYFRTIAPWVEVDARVECLQHDSAERLLAGNPDYVVDTIGDLPTKLQLLKYCHEHKIPVMSSMSAGAKADPSRVQISDISETFEDPLSRAVRRRLKKLGVDYGIDVVYSTEKPHKAKSLDQSSSSQSYLSAQSVEYRPLPDFDVNPLPALVPLSAMFGMSMATFITCKLGNWAMEPQPIKYRMEIYQHLFRELQSQEEATYLKGGKLSLDRYDMGYVFEEMFRGRSAISKSMDKLVVCRWRRELPLSLLNVVVMTESEKKSHLALPIGADLQKIYGKEIYDYVQGQFREEELINNL